MSNANEPVHPTMCTTGLTKRELFAAMAMQGLLANAASGRVSVSSNEAMATYSDLAVGYADALLAELAKAQP